MPIKRKTPIPTTVGTGIPSTGVDVPAPLPGNAVKHRAKGKKRTTHASTQLATKTAMDVPIDPAVIAINVRQFDKTRNPAHGRSQATEMYLGVLRKALNVP